MLNTLEKIHPASRGVAAHTAGFSGSEQKLIFTMFPVPLSPHTLENAAIYTAFFNFSMLANSKTYIQKIMQTHCFLQCFYNVFRRKHRNLYVFRHKVGPKHWFLQCLQWHQKNLQFPDLPKPRKTPLFTLFSSIFPCANAAGQLKHINEKSLKDIPFFSVFTFFSVKNAVIYMFFGIKSVQNTGFCSVFKALASKNHSTYRYLQCFFIFVRFSIAGSLPK